MPMIEYISSERFALAVCLAGIYARFLPLVASQLIENNHATITQGYVFGVFLLSCMVLLFCSVFALVYLMVLVSKEGSHSRP